MPLPTGVYRADHVGSFLRSTEIKGARKKHKTGELSNQQLRQVEDDEIAKLVDLELESGLKSVSDGEYRRAWYALFVNVGV